MLASADNGDALFRFGQDFRSSRNQQSSSLSDRLMTELSAHRTLALREASRQRRREYGLAVVAGSATV